ncbi:MAG: DUF1048 domain-containing protein [Oscillospiraceae bacterium]
MRKFFNEYFNIKKIMADKREYKQNMARVDALPKEYRFVFEKIQRYMWMNASGSGYDILNIQYDLVELFEEGAANGRPVLELTGEDVAAFCDELLRSAHTYTENWRETLNRDIRKKLGKKEDAE